MRKHMKIRRGWILSLCVVLLVTVLAGCSAKEKETVIGSGMWPEYTFQSAVDRAVTIVYGTAGEKSETKSRDISLNPEKPTLLYYRDVPMEVKELPKGEKGSDGTVIYQEQGGETDTQIFITEGLEEVEPGKEYILFLNEIGAVLSPALLLPVENGEVKTSGGLVPDSAKDSNGKAPDTMTVEAYLDAVEAAVRSSS